MPVICNVGLFMVVSKKHGLGQFLSWSAAIEIFPCIEILSHDHLDEIGRRRKRGRRRRASGSSNSQASKPEFAKQLFRRRGPCVGTLFATEEFYRMGASDFSHRAPVAFRGCPREKREEVRGSDPDAAMHAVVCYAYRHNRRGKLLVLVVDNQQATGPSKWVHFDEFNSFYVLLGRSELPGQVWFHLNFWARSRSTSKIKRFFAEVHYKPHPPTP
ncbi:hypothetical protein C2845_PM10G03820 [Panicum miliaceum]|uniref:DUF3615 domain-containing protein n=1 Tax=Panicum miliaceum TaxID=4540 RepID=A0A3L6PG68_PANMI|nr:hypothetical protein C2845_PM10G03820 [Panicum miliaceum]